MPDTEIANVLLTVRVRIMNVDSSLWHRVEWPLILGDDDLPFEPFTIAGHHGDGSVLAIRSMYPITNDEAHRLVELIDDYCESTFNQPVRSWPFADRPIECNLPEMTLEQIAELFGVCTHCGREACDMKHLPSLV